MTGHHTTPSMIRCAATFRTALFATALVVLTACGGGVGGVEPAPLPAFYFESSTPPPDAIAAVLDQIVTVTFNKPLDPTTVATNSLTVTSATVSTISGTTILVDDGEGRTLRWTLTPGSATNSARPSS